MSEVSVYNQAGQETGEKLELPAAIFARSAVKPAVVQFVAAAMLANLRTSTAATKTRGQVRGGGKKPWKQKGTGRARAGSIRSPLWRGGGVVFGPTVERNYSKKVNRKTKRLGLFAVLSSRAQEGRLAVMDNLELSSGKTRELVAKLAALGTILKGKRILIITAEKPEALQRAARNLPEVKLCLAKNLNLLDLLWSESIIVLKNALPVMTKTYLGNPN